MGGLRLYAIDIDAVRDMFGAPEALATRLRAIAAREFGPKPKPPEHGLLGKLGPLFRRPLIDAPPPIAPDRPVPSDVDALLSGHFVSPERLPAAWRLVEAWIAAEAVSSWHADWDARQLTDLEFALARARMSSRFGIQRLLDAPAGIPLRPAQGLHVGYLQNEHAVAMAEAFAAAVPNLSDEERPLIAPLATWLAEVTHVDGSARRPDLIALFSEPTPSA